MADVDKIIESVFYNVHGGFGSIVDTYRKVKKRPGGEKITRAQVADFIKRQEIRQRRRKPLKNSFVALGPRMEYQMDVANMVQVNREPADREDAAAHDPVFKFALVAVDIFSKAIAVVPLANTRQESTTKALDTVIDSLGPCNVIMTDRGREFEGAFHERVTKYYDIEHLYSIIYCRFAERAIRTIKEMILQRQQATGLKWTELLEPVVRSYNSTAREGTGMLPEEAHLDENLVKAHKSLLRHAKFKSKQPPLAVGDYVKIIQKRGNYYDRKFDISDYGNVMRPVQGIKESVDGLKMYTVDGRDYLRYELLKVKDAAKPPREPPQPRARYDPGPPPVVPRERERRPQDLGPARSRARSRSPALQDEDDYPLALFPPPLPRYRAEPAAPAEPRFRYTGKQPPRQQPERRSMKIERIRRGLAELPDEDVEPILAGLWPPPQAGPAPPSPLAPPSPPRLPPRPSPPRLPAGPSPPRLPAPQSPPRLPPSPPRPPAPPSPLAPPSPPRLPPPPSPPRLPPPSPPRLPAAPSPQRETYIERLRRQADEQRRLIDTTEEHARRAVHRARFNAIVEELRQLTPALPLWAIPPERRTVQENISEYQRLRDNAPTGYLRRFYARRLRDAMARLEEL